MSLMAYDLKTVIIRWKNYKILKLFDNIILSILVYKKKLSIFYTLYVFFVKLLLCAVYLNQDNNNIQII